MSYMTKQPFFGAPASPLFRSSTAPFPTSRPSMLTSFSPTFRLPHFTFVATKPVPTFVSRAYVQLKHQTSPARRPPFTKLRVPLFPSHRSPPSPSPPLSRSECPEVAPQICSPRTTRQRTSPWQNSCGQAVQGIASPLTATGESSRQSSVESCRMGGSSAWMLRWSVSIRMGGLGDQRGERWKKFSLAWSYGALLLVTFLKLNQREAAKQRPRC